MPVQRSGGSVTAHPTVLLPCQRGPRNSGCRRHRSSPQQLQSLPPPRHSHGPRGSWVRFLVGMLLGGALLLLVVRALQRSLQYGGMNRWVVRYLLPTSTVDFNGPGSVWRTAFDHPRTDAARVRGQDIMSCETYFLWARDATGAFYVDRPRPVVLYLHGNRAGMYHNAKLHGLQRLTAAGVHVALLEYRGYGTTPGSPSERAIVADVVQLVGLLRRCRYVHPDLVFLHGYSLGGALAAMAAAHCAPAGLVLEATMASFSGILHALGVVAPNLVDRLDTAAALARCCDFPVLQLCGDKDLVVTTTQREAIDAAVRQSHARAGVPAWVTAVSRLHLLPGHGHIDAPGRADLWGAILAFLQAVGLHRTGIDFWSPQQAPHPPPKDDSNSASTPPSVAGMHGPVPPAATATCAAGVS